jgi:ribonuclease P protein component
MIGRLLRKSDFERVLAVPPCSRSAHFAVHFLQTRPDLAQPPGDDTLSTGDAPMLTDSVDNLVSNHWLGQVVPKRHAPRSVSRNMLRRQVRAAMERHVSRLRPGLWLVRLRQPFLKKTFASADSNLLRSAVSAELDRLFERAAACASRAVQ